MARGSQLADLGLRRWKRRPATATIRSAILIGGVRKSIVVKNKMYKLKIILLYFKFIPSCAWRDRSACIDQRRLSSETLGSVSQPRRLLGLVSASAARGSGSVGGGGSLWRRRIAACGGGGSRPAEAAAADHGGDGLLRVGVGGIAGGGSSRRRRIAARGDGVSRLAEAAYRGLRRRRRIAARGGG